MIDRLLLLEELRRGDMLLLTARYEWYDQQVFSVLR